MVGTCKSTDRDNLSNTTRVPGRLEVIVEVAAVPVPPRQRIGRDAALARIASRAWHAAASYAHAGAVDQRGGTIVRTERRAPSQRHLSEIGLSPVSDLRHPGTAVHADAFDARNLIRGVASCASMPDRRRRRNAHLERHAARCCHLQDTVPSTASVLRRRPLRASRVSRPGSISSTGPLGAPVEARFGSLCRRPQI